MSISDSQQKREAVVEDFRTIRLSSGRNLTEDTPQTAVSPWDYPTTRSCGFSQDQLKTYDDSDAESHGSEEELLENAGVWNIEEAHRILRDKMKKLQKLYTLQMKHLNMEYKMQRRKYLLEKAQCLSRTKQGPSHAAPLQTYQKDFKVQASKQLSRELLIKAKTRQCLRQYCKRRGIDAVLYKRQQIRKQQQAMAMLNKQGHSKYSHSQYGNSMCMPSSHSLQLIKEEENVCSKNTAIIERKMVLDRTCSEQGLVAGRCKMCEELALPLTLHCKDHIKHDGKQLLFTYCSHSGCKRVVFPGDNDRCPYHPHILDLLPPAPVIKEEPTTVDKGTSTKPMKPQIISSTVIQSPHPSTAGGFHGNTKLTYPVAKAAHASSSSHGPSRTSLASPSSYGIPKSIPGTAIGTQGVAKGSQVAYSSGQPKQPSKHPLPSSSGSLSKAATSPSVSHSKPIVPSNQQTHSATTIHPGQAPIPSASKPGITGTQIQQQPPAKPMPLQKKDPVPPSGNK